MIKFNSHQRVACSKRYKKKYNHSFLNKGEAKILKICEEKELLDKNIYGINGYFNSFPRLENGAIQWDKVDDNTKDGFSFLMSKLEKLNKKISNIEDEEINRIKHKARNTYGYGGSF